MRGGFIRAFNGWEDNHRAPPLAMAKTESTRGQGQDRSLRKVVLGQCGCLKRRQRRFPVCLDNCDWLLDDFLWDWGLFCL